MTYPSAFATSEYFIFSMHIFFGGGGGVWSTARGAVGWARGEGRYRKPTWWSEGWSKEVISKVRKRNPNGDSGSYFGTNEIRTAKI